MSAERAPRSGDYLWWERDEFAHIPTWDVRFGNREEYSAKCGWLLAKCWDQENAAVITEALRTHYRALLPRPGR